ncbi:MAG TPA: MFS transporter [Limnobacter sp.]|nr:MFS transporter [Limnobacter sp.]
MNRILATVLTCHFLGAFTVLGMPVYLPQLLTEMGASNQSAWVGFLFAWPTLLTAISAPWWGRFSDRHGRRLSLTRALIGLSMAFVAAGLSQTMLQLFASLTVQGLMGGTLSAANAYLASTKNNQTLASQLNWTQFSARLALVCAPVLLAWFVQGQPLQRIYLGLALLPLLGALLTFTLPKDLPAVEAHQTNTSKHCPPAIMIGVHGLFSLAMVVTFPYFLPYSQQAGFSLQAMALLFVLPHAVYLIAQSLLKTPDMPWLSQAQLGLLSLMLSAGLQWWILNATAILIARVLMGIGMWLTYQGLHRWVAASLPRQHAGQWLGGLDSIGKLAGVLAGLLAGLSIPVTSLSTPFLISAISSLMAALVLLYFTSTLGKDSSPCTSNTLHN